MMKKCFADKSEVGIVLSLPKGIAHVGCSAEILEVVKRYPDGRMDIVTVGRAPFRVVELFTEHPLLEGQVDYLEDREATGNPVVQRRHVERYEACHTRLCEDYPNNREGTPAGELSYRVESA